MGRLVGRMRHECGMNQVQFAEKAGMSPGSVARIEAGRTLADHVQLRRIERALRDGFETRAGDLMYLTEEAAARLRRSGVRIRWKRREEGARAASRQTVDRVLVRVVTRFYGERSEDEE